MFYFRRVESCSLGLITLHFPTATVSGSPLPLQQTHKKSWQSSLWCRQVKSNMSVIVSRCGTGRRFEVSACVCDYVKMNAAESARFLYKFSVCSLSVLSVLDYIINKHQCGLWCWNRWHLSRRTRYQTYSNWLTIFTTRSITPRYVLTQLPHSVSRTTN